MFRSFTMAGFDCTHGRNRHGVAIDNSVATKHSACLDDDYRRLADIGIRTVRDGAPWPAIQPSPRALEWERLDAIVAAAERQQVELIHDFCHFGVPGHIDLFSTEFPKQFSEFCYQATRRIAVRSNGSIAITPFNEPSYFAWAAAHAALFPPYRREQAFELKVQLARAIIAGIDAIWAAVPEAVIVNVDPICRAVAPIDRPDLAAAVEHFNKVAVFESLDMISGKLLPELGGSLRHLGIVGVNYYWTNQWELGREDIPLIPDDPRAVTLGVLLQQVWERYGTDIVITESGHIDDERPGWARQLTADVMTTLRRGIPLRGVCLYPVLGMPSWHEPERWLRMGLWDIVDGERVLHKAMLNALAELMSMAPHEVKGGFDGRANRTARGV